MIFIREMVVQHISVMGKNAEGKNERAECVGGGREDAPFAH